MISQKLTCSGFDVRQKIKCVPHFRTQLFISCLSALSPILTSERRPIFSLINDENLICFVFKKYQVPALCNLGTAFGMGLIVTMFMMGQGAGYIKAAIIGNIGAIIGSIVSVRLMLRQTKNITVMRQMIQLLK